MKNYTLKPIEKLLTIKQMKNYLKVLENVTGEKMLDVGSGEGIFSVIASLKPAIKTITCLDEEYPTLVNKNPKIKFIKGLFPKKLFKKYDDIILLEVLEHNTKEEQKEILRCCKEHLNKKGKIHITLPNGSRMFRRGKTYKDHIYETPHQELLDMFKETGLKVNKIKMLEHRIFCFNPKYAHRNYYQVENS